MPDGGSQFRFSEPHAAAAVAFFERFCRLTEGEWAGQPFRLQPWQRERIIRPAFGWRRADGTRRYRQVYVEVARKNGKTELAAGIGLALTVADGEPGAQVYSAAVDRDQAKIVFNKAGAMVRFSPDLRTSLDVFNTAIFCAALSSSFKPLSSGAAAKHGYNPSGLIGDEVHAWRDAGEMVEVIRKGMAARRQPLEFYITTAGERRGYGWELHRYARRVLAGEIEDDAFLAVIFAADDEDDWTAEETWRKANPNLGISVKLDFLRKECERAKALPRLENDFRRYHLCQWTEQVERWLPMDAWRACAGELDGKALEGELAGRECFGGLDLSSTRDLTALCWLFPPGGPGQAWLALWRFWLPEAALTARAELRDGVPYRDWAKAGWLQTTPGDVVDYGFVREQINRDGERFRVTQLAYDPWNATQLALELAGDGAPVIKFRQNFASLAAPTKELERLVIGRELDHGHNPVATWQAGNIAVKMDAAGNFRPAKDRSGDRIDGLVALIMALGLATAKETKPPSVYERRGMAAI